MALLSSCVLASGCWLSHEAETSAPLCGSAPPLLEVTLEALLPGEPCAPGPIEGFAIEVEGADDSISITLATCPPDVICVTNRVCRVVVDAGADGIAIEIGEMLFGFVEPPHYARLGRALDCCGGPTCSCRTETVLFARRDNPARALPELDAMLDLAFDVGPTTCGPIGGTRPMCGWTEFSIEASTAGGSVGVEVPPRETRSLGDEVRVQNRAAANNTCEDSGPLAAWIAWRTRLGP